jgi:hypothetical protein
METPRSFGIIHDTLAFLDTPNILFLIEVSAGSVSYLSDQGEYYDVLFVIFYNLIMVLANLCPKDKC